MKIILVQVKLLKELDTQNEKKKKAGRQVESKTNSQFTRHYVLIRFRKSIS